MALDNDIRSLSAVSKRMVNSSLVVFKPLRKTIVLLNIFYISDTSGRSSVFLVRVCQSKFTCTFNNWKYLKFREFIASDS